MTWLWNATSNRVATIANAITAMPSVVERTGSGLPSLRAASIRTNTAVPATRVACASALRLSALP